MACRGRPHIPASTTHLIHRVHIGALFEQQRRGSRVTIPSRVVKGRVFFILHTRERGEESGRANMRWSRGVEGGWGRWEQAATGPAWRIYRMVMQPREQRRAQKWPNWTFFALDQTMFLA